MKILHVTDNYTPQGGVQQYILSVGHLLAENGHSNVVLYTEQSDISIKDNDLPAYHVRTDQGMTAKVRQVLAAEQPDVAYMHQVASPALVTAVAKALPTVAYLHGFTAVCPGLAKYFRHGDQVCERPFGWGCVPMHYLRRCSAARRPSTLARLMRNTAGLKKALLRVSRFLVGSSYMADLLAQNGFPAGRTTVLPPHFLPDDAQLSYHPPEEPNSILYAGRLEIEKGVPYLLQVLVKLPSDVRLVVAGDGTQRVLYERMVQQFGVADRVAFLGWLNKETLGNTIDRCRLLVMPSIWPEPFGKVGVDALARGRPVVACEVGGIPDWLDDGVTGLLARPADSADLAKKIEALLADRRLQETMGRSGQRIVAKRYSAEHHVNTLETTFREAIGK